MKEKKQNRLLYLLLAITMIFALFNTFYVKNASAEIQESSTSANLFDMNLFDTDNIIVKTSNLSVVAISDSGIICDMQYDSQLSSPDVYKLYSGDFYIQSGDYTLSFFVEGLAEYEIIVTISMANGGTYVQNIDVNSENLQIKTFSVPETAYYRLNFYIGNVEPFQDTIRFSVNDIMLNSGSIALPFVPFNYDISNAEQVDELSNNIDDILSQNLGTLENLSIGAFLIIFLIAIILLKKR